MPHTEVRAFRAENGAVPLVEWLADLKKKNYRCYKKCVHLLIRLNLEGAALKMPHSKPLRNGIHELRGRVGTVNCRPLYALLKSTSAVVTHGLLKEGEVPSGEIDRAIERVALAKSDTNKFTVVYIK